MIGVKDYLLIQYKRIFKLLPGMICMIALVAILLSAALYGVLNSEKYKSEQIRYKLGLVGGTENEMVDLGVHMLETEDDMQYVLDLVQFDDEEEARAALRNADISAYIVITKEFDDADKPLPKSEQQKMDEKFKDYKHWADEANAAKKKADKED